MKSKEKLADQPLVIDDLRINRLYYNSKQGRVLESKIFVLNFPLS
jgi:hypothetical protein